MLVLSRKLLQQIFIPDLNIRITVLSVGTNRVQLGIEAPNSIQITRPEICGLFCARPRLGLSSKGIPRTPGLNSHRVENNIHEPSDVRVASGC